jgi:hypothetical protein
VTSTWPTPPENRCWRCPHIAHEHSRYTTGTHCALCNCPRFTGPAAWFVHLVTRWWP